MTTTQHLPVEKSAFMDAVGSSTIYQGAGRRLAHLCLGWQEYRPWSWLWALWWFVNWPQPLSAVIQESLENTVLDSQPWTWEPWQKSRFAAEKIQHSIRAENTSLNALDRVRGLADFTCKPISPQQHSSVPRQTFWAHGFFHRGMWGCGSEHWGSPEVRNAARHWFSSCSTWSTEQGAAWLGCRQGPGERQRALGEH